MHILMVSPHPTYSPRGTPISVLNRCRALCALGHTVDLVTYGIGTDVPIDGLTWLRAPVPGITSVKVGPSVQKVPLDLAVFVRSAVQAVRGRYDVIHTHEEAGLIGAGIARIRRMPHVYDMGNDLSVVLRNYGFSQRHPLTRLASGVETATVRGSDSVIAHFPAIAQRVAEIDASIPVTVVANVPIEAPADQMLSARLRAEWAPDGTPVVAYTGTLERYQGVTSAVEAVAALRRKGTRCRFVVVGGTVAQQSELAETARAERIEDDVLVLGSVSQDLIGSYLAAADVLISPRVGGSNTPLKIFSYMHSGRPILATAIPSHEQALDASTATLVASSVEGLRDGLAEVLSNPAAARLRGERAQAVAVERHGIAAYVRDVASAYVAVGGEHPTPVGVEQASALLSDTLLTPSAAA